MTMIGKTFSHYKILAKLGEGGMGVVYCAKDTRLKRTVALKFLPPQLTADPEAKERFIQEAQAASSLDHTNICTIHEINETEDGQLYIVMPCYEGQTLKDKLTDGAISVETALDIAEQIAKGLAKAHAKGIVHRDIKPANLFITSDGVVKILDFGIAKLAGQTLHTKTGSTLGTVAYMSPEQAQGLPVDHRTDIWSLGVVLYEMLAGRLPFTGEYEQAIMYQIVSMAPAPVQNYCSTLPVALAHILDRLLEKDPNKRYISLEAVLVDLNFIRENKILPSLSFAVVNGDKSTMRQKSKSIWKALVLGIVSMLVAVALIYHLFWGRSTLPAKYITLAVADFDNQTGEKALDGLSDFLITSLDQSNKINVLTRDRMFDILKQMGKEPSSRFDQTIAKEICRYASVNILITASVIKLGKLYAIDLKVNDINKEQYLYADKAQGEGQESVLDMIDALSLHIRKNLKEEEFEIDSQNEQVADISTSNLEAHRHYYSAVQLHIARSYTEALAELDQAIALDSTFALAYFRKILMAERLMWSDAKRKAILNKSLLLINKLPVRERNLLQVIDLKEKKGWEAAIEPLQNLERIYPNDKEILIKIAERYLDGNNFILLEKYSKQILTVDPTEQRALVYLSWSYEERSMYDEFFQTAKRLVAVAGIDPKAYFSIAKGAVLTGQYNEGIESLEKARLAFPNSPEIIQYLGSVYSYKGDFGKAEILYQELIGKEQPIGSRRFGCFLLGLLYPYQGKYRKALTMFDARIKLSQQAQDSIAVANAHMRKAIFSVWSHNNLTFSKIEWDKAKLYRKKNTNPVFGDGLLSAYFGAYDAADSIAAGLGKDEQTLITALVQMRQGCDIVKTYPADFYLKPRWNYYQIFLNYNLAICQIEIGRLDDALLSLKRLQEKYDIFGYHAVFYPKSFYLLGKLYEKRDDTAQAIKSYAKLIEFWKNGDQDLPELIDAKERLARLQGKK